MAFKKSQVLKTLIFSAVLIFIGFLIPQSVGLGAGGFDVDITLKQFTFYLSGAVFLIGVILLVFSELIINKHDKRYGDSLAFVSPGDTPGLKIFGRFSLFSIFFASLIIFSIIGFFSAFTQQTAFTDYATLEQQFTPTSQLLFSSLLIPIAENLGLAFVIAMFLFILRWNARKINMTKVNFRILSIFFSFFIAGFYGLINHVLRYQGSDSSLTIVFFFWAIMGVITVVIGSFIPAWMMHFSNNFFFDIKNLFGSDAFVSISASFIIISIIIFITYYFGIKKILNKKSTNILENG